MNITSPSRVRKLKFIDVVYDSGRIHPLTIDIEAGDSYDRDEYEIRVHLSEKTNPLDPEKVLPAEDIVIFVAKVASILTRDVEMPEATDEQRIEMKKFIQGGFLGNTRIQ